MNFLYLGTTQRTVGMIISRDKGQLVAKLSSIVITTTQHTQVFLPLANFRIPFLLANWLPVNKININVYLKGLVRISDEIKCGEINL